MKDTDIVSKAEQVMKGLSEQVFIGRDGRERKNGMVTTSQIRKFLTAVNTVTEKINKYRLMHPDKADTLSEDLVAEVQFLKVKLAYQVGRDPKEVKPFMEKAELMKEIDGIGNNPAAYDRFSKYIEALVAFHKFYGGKD